MLRVTFSLLYSVWSDISFWVILTLWVLFHGFRFIPMGHRSHGSVLLCLLWGEDHRELNDLSSLGRSDGCHLVSVSSVCSVVCMTDVWFAYPLHRVAKCLSTLPKPFTLLEVLQLCAVKHHLGRPERVHSPLLGFPGQALSPSSLSFHPRPGFIVFSV